jgi:hypothetical protein
LSEQKKSRGGQVKHDWFAIERDYVEGIDGAAERFPTFEDMANKWGILANNLRARAAKDHWAQKREVFQNKIREVRQEKVADSIADGVARLSRRNFKSLDAVSIMVNNKIAEAIGRKELLSNIVMREFVDLIDNCERIARRMLGEDETEREFAQSGAYGGRELPKAKWTVTNGRNIIDAFILPTPSTEHVNGSGGPTQPE